VKIKVNLHSTVDENYENNQSFSDASNQESLEEHHQANSESESSNGETESPMEGDETGQKRPLESDNEAHVSRVTTCAEAQLVNSDIQSEMSLGVAKKPRRSDSS